jgi:hypothetical protein
MLNVMRVDKTRVVTTGKRTAFVPGNQGAFDGRWHGSGLATDIQWFSILIFTDNHRIGLSGLKLAVMHVLAWAQQAPMVLLVFLERFPQRH